MALEDTPELNTPALTPAEELDTYVSKVWRREADYPEGYGEITFGMEEAPYSLNTGPNGATYWCWISIYNGSVDEFVFRKALPRTKGGRNFTQWAGRVTVEDDYATCEWGMVDGVEKSFQTSQALAPEIADAMILHIGNCATEGNMMVLDYPEPPFWQQEEIDEGIQVTEPEAEVVAADSSEEECPEPEEYSPRLQRTRQLLMRLACGIHMALND